MLTMCVHMCRQAMQYKKLTNDHIPKKKMSQFSGKIYIQIISKKEFLKIIYTRVLSGLVLVMPTQNTTAIVSS